MAMGAFLAGVLLAESNFRHQLEADIEPFRGILLGLFFMSVGMSIDAGIVLAATGRRCSSRRRPSWSPRSPSSPSCFGCSARPGATPCAAARCSRRRASSRSCCCRLAAALGLLSPLAAQFLTALAALTMLVGPLRREGASTSPSRACPIGSRSRISCRSTATHGTVLVIGFGRFGQVVNQVLLAENIDVTVIDNNVDRIRAAARFGFRVYYGDGHAARRAARRRRRPGGPRLRLRRRPRGGAQDRRDPARAIPAGAHLRARL